MGVARVAEEVAIPLAQCLLAKSPAGRNWAGLFVLERPSARRALRVKLLRQLVRMGIYRDLSDLPEVGACAIGGMLASIARGEARHMAAIVAHVCGALQKGAVRLPTSADATWLGLMLSRESLRTLGKEAGERGHFAETLELALWLRTVEKAGEPARPPSSDLAWSGSRRVLTGEFADGGLGAAVALAGEEIHERFRTGWTLLAGKSGGVRGDDRGVDSRGHSRLARPRTSDPRW